MEHLVFNRTLHQKFWNIISNYPGCTITHILANCCLNQGLENDEYYLINIALNHSLACQFAREAHKKYFYYEKDIKIDDYEEYPDNKLAYCNFCPFNIKDSNNSCLDGLYSKWAKLNHNCETEKQKEETKQLALQIANFEIKSNVEYI